LSYADYEGEVRARMEDCITGPADGVAFTEDEQAALKKQLWSAELGESSDYKYYIRNVCTNDVLKKVNDNYCNGHSDMVFYGQNCRVKHFDVAVTDKSNCVDGQLYNVNHCLFDKHVVG
jgi:hypothetical protein